MCSGGRTVPAEPCLFCADTFRGEIVARCGTVFAVPDLRPVSEGHHLVVTERHTADFFSMTCEERKDCDTLLGRLREQILADDPTVTGFNVGANCGVSAGQQVMHAHVHLIPRREGTPVKGVIRNRLSY